MKLIVSSKGELLDYLYSNIKEHSKKQIKSFLSHGNIRVNDVMTTKFDYSIKKNDTILINLNKSADIEVLYEDKYIIIVNKPANILTVATKPEDKTLYKLVSEYTKKQHKSNKIFIVHRLDKETSGILIFAKDEKTKELFQNNWNSVTRVYHAICVGILEGEGTLQSYLLENNSHFVYEDRKGLLAITHYKKIKEINGNTLLEINIETGRKNQIRVQLNNKGFPVFGDLKYGKSKARRMYLHASKISFEHPVTHKMVTVLSRPEFM